MIYLVIVGSIVGYSAYVYALKYLPIATVSLYAYVNPIIAVILGSLLLDEPFGVAHRGGRAWCSRGSRSSGRMPPVTRPARRRPRNARQEPPEHEGSQLTRAFVSVVSFVLLRLPAALVEDASEALVPRGELVAAGCLRRWRGEPDECGCRARRPWPTMNASTVRGSTGDAVVARAVVRHDQVLDLRAKIVGEAGDAVDGVAHQDQPEPDVADEVAVARVGRAARLVVRAPAACRCREAATPASTTSSLRVVGARELAADLRHLQRVLEQAAAIGVVNVLRRRPLAQLALRDRRRFD